MEENQIYTKAVHAGKDPKKFNGSISVPVFNSAAYAFCDVDEAAAINSGLQPGYAYGRKGNPTQETLEKALSTLENGEAAIALSSGMAAITCTLFTLLKPGDHIIATRSLYAATSLLLDEVMSPLGFDITLVDGTDSRDFEKAITARTKVLYLESPANPTLNIVDIAKVVEIANTNNLTTVIDNTFATPFNQRPLELAVDVSIHSASKYLGGHGDLISGAIVSTSKIVEEVRWHTNKLLGSVIAPQTAWLVLRGIRTLALRMERHNANALAVAEFLEDHAKIHQVFYPGLPSHPQHEIAKKQMSGFGGMVAFDVGGILEGKKLMNAVKLCTLAVSLGNVETLIQHSASMTHAPIPREQRLAAGITDGLIRLSVGIERAEDIIADLDQALAKI